MKSPDFEKHRVKKLCAPTASRPSPPQVPAVPARTTAKTPWHAPRRPKSAPTGARWAVGPRTSVFFRYLVC